MSSKVKEDFVPGKQLVVHIAENGHSFEVVCDESMLVEAVQKCIETVSGIHFKDQLLLCQGSKLESQRSLSAYKLPCNGSEIFIYNRSRLLRDSLPPQLEQIDIPEVSDLPKPSSCQDQYPLDDALDPALKALPLYESQFRYHFESGHIIYKCSRVKFKNCERLLREQKVQERAMETALGSMDHYYRMIHQMYTDFMKCYLQQHRYHSDLLVNFGKDVEKLRSCKFHPALRTQTRKCLLDLVKEENLRKWADNCNISQQQFEVKVSQLKQTFIELKGLKRRVEDMYCSNAFAAIRDLELMIKAHQRYLNDQTSIMQSLSKDVNTVKKLVDDYLSCQLSASLRPHDAVSALGSMYDVHDKRHLPKMNDCDRSISKLLNFCKERKNEMNLFVHNCMQKVSYVQLKIKDVRLQLPAFKEAMAHQDRYFESLKLVGGIGPAYRACLAEVVRRKSSMKIYMGMAGKLVERLATKREVEVRRREEFLKAHSVFIPEDILASMGLFDTPNQCVVNLVPFDTNLLEIDIADIDHYAPEYLVRIPFKCEKHGASKGSFSMSNDSSQSAEAEENSVESSQKYDHEELLEGCESIEIVGTSKLEVENVRLKAELASAITLICSFRPEIEYDLLDDRKLDSALKNAAARTAEALHLKDRYAKHLKSMLRMKQMQCLSYERRIHELEQRLSDHYLQGKKFSVGKVAPEFAHSSVKDDDCKLEVSGNGEEHIPYISNEPIDELSCTPASFDSKLEQFPRSSGEVCKGVNENMTDSSGMLNPLLDSSMLEQLRAELQVGDKSGQEKMVAQLDLSLSNDFTVGTISEPLNMLPCETAVEPGSASNTRGDIVLELQNAHADKSNQCFETETKLKAAMKEVKTLRRELEISQKLLDESQMNCAHLENCLHEAREEAHSHLCAADRKASECSTMCAPAVKMDSLLKRLQSCISAMGGMANFVESSCGLALSLAVSVNGNKDGGTVEFRACIHDLADKFDFLSWHHAELLEKLKLLMDTLQGSWRGRKNWLKDNTESITANKEKLSFGHSEAQEIAALLSTLLGNMRRSTATTHNYYLSAESVAIFIEHLLSRPSYISGQIVHIERHTVRPPPPVWFEHSVDQVDHLSSDTGTHQLALASTSKSNLFGHSIGCEYL